MTQETNILKWLKQYPLFTTNDIMCTRRFKSWVFIIYLQVCNYSKCGTSHNIIVKQSWYAVVSSHQWNKTQKCFQQSRTYYTAFPCPQKELSLCRAAEVWGKIQLGLSMGHIKDTHIRDNRSACKSQLANNPSSVHLKTKAWHMRKHPTTKMQLIYQYEQNPTFLVYITKPHRDIFLHRQQP